MDLIIDDVVIIFRFKVKMRVIIVSLHIEMRSS